VVGSPGFESIAALAAGDRTARLQSLQVPALVLHGAADVMCDVSGGRATAAAIPDAKLVIATHIAELVHRAEAITPTT
jgi:pimeloyl-ACP methyl ester carboxylesterase